MIAIQDKNFTRFRLNTQRTYACIQNSLKKYGITDNVEIELHFVGLQRMRKLNRTYRQKDYATDVLSFPIWPDLATIKEQVHASPISLGSIVICLPVAQRDAVKEGQPLEGKITFLIEHSILHLLGFHHEGD